MNQDQSLQLHNLLTKDDPTSRIEAANLFFQWTESDSKVSSLAEAEEVLYSIYIELLNRGQLTEAALLLWGNELFDPRPRSVQMIWNGLKKYNKILIPGASSLGKSYNPAAWAILWWTHDPKYTSIKVVSVTGEHAASQIMATMKMFHEASVIPLPGVIKDRSIDLADGDKRASISRVSIPQGPDIKGRLRGFHPQPRPWHPIFGKKTRIAVIIDEGEDVPSNIWEGIENLLATEGTNTHHIKIVSGANPKKRESPYAQRCEYPGGWQNFDLETSDEWDGPEALQSWHVIRLDGAKCENVVEKREVFPNMITYEGYMNYVRKGTNSSEYYCVDDQTEVLSSRGWIGVDSLSSGDDIYTLNTKSGLCEWRPVNFVFQKPFSGIAHRIIGSSIDALVTPDHSWPATNKDRIKKGVQEYKLRTTEKLCKHDLIPLAREYSNPEEGNNDPDFAELLGWVVTEGTFRKPGRRVVIYQSRSYNPEKCIRIRNLLERLNALSSEWISKDGIIHFRVNSEWSDRIRIFVPNKKLTVQCVNFFNLESKRAMLEAIILGDGGIQGGGTKYACVNDKDQAEVYAALMVFCGISPRIHTREIPYSYKGKSDNRTQYYINTRKHKHHRIQYWDCKKEEHSFIAWCPNTDNGTFLAKRNGRIYWTGNTFARGAWPEAGAEFRITPSDNFKNSTGTLVFSGDVHSVASLDPAFSEGGDSAVMTVGKYGMAIGWTTAENKYNKWDISHPALQIEQQFPVPKDNTLIMAQTIMRMLKALDVRAEWFVMDRTGNAHGLYDAIRLQYGDILGQQWGEGATIKKILEEDSMNAEDQYAGVNTEMMFAFSKWLEFGYVKFAPMMDVSKIYNQAINRKYVFYKTLSRAEDKISYKASSGGQSPDEYDSAIMLVHLARMRHAQKAHMLPATLLAASEEISDTTEYGVTDVLGFVDLSLDK